TTAMQRRPRDPEKGRKPLHGHIEAGLQGIQLGDRQPGLDDLDHPGGGERPLAAGPAKVIADDPRRARSARSLHLRQLIVSNAQTVKRRSHPYRSGASNSTSSSGLSPAAICETSFPVTGPRLSPSIA